MRFQAVRQLDSTCTALRGAIEGAAVMERAASCCIVVVGCFKAKQARDDYWLVATLMLAFPKTTFFVFFLGAYPALGCGRGRYEQCLPARRRRGRVRRRGGRWVLLQHCGDVWKQDPRCKDLKPSRPLYRYRRLTDRLHC